MLSMGDDETAIQNDRVRAFTDTDETQVAVPTTIRERPDDYYPTAAQAAGAAWPKWFCRLIWWLTIIGCGAVVSLVIEVAVAIVDWSLRSPQ